MDYAFGADIFKKVFKNVLHLFKMFRAKLLHSLSLANAVNWSFLEYRTFLRFTSFFKTRKCDICTEGSHLLHSKNAHILTSAKQVDIMHIYFV